MGIVIDIILVAIIAISIFLGYKVGLVKLGTGLIAGLIAIILTLVIYKPIAGVIIDKTELDEKIESTIIENTQKTIDNNVKTENIVTDQINNEILPEQAKNVSTQVVYALTAIIIFILSKVILRIIISLLDFVAKLPIIKQFNKIGGIAYGLIRGAIVSCICVLLLGAYSNINPQSNISSGFEESNLTKLVYENIVKI